MSLAACQTSYYNDLRFVEATPTPPGAGRPDLTATAAAEFTLPIVDGVNDPLTLVEAAIENGSLVVLLDAAYEGIEPHGEEFLITGQDEIPARMEIHSNNDVVLTFDGVSEASGTVVLSGVNQTSEADITARIGDGSFLLPDGSEASFHAVRRIWGRMELNYVTSAPTSMTISVATISNGEQMYATGGTSHTIFASGAVQNASIRFPLEAEPLLRDPDSVLRITELRRGVRYEIELSGS